MKRRSIKVAKWLVNFLMILLLVFSLGALGLSVYNSVSYNVEASKYIYVLLGIFIIPFEYLATGSIGKLQEQKGTVIGLILSLVLCILAIVVLVNSSKMFNGKYSSLKRTIAGTVTNMLLVIFFAVFAFGAVILTIYSNQITNLINSVGPEFIKMIIVNFGFNALFIKEIAMGYLGLLICLVGLIVFIIGLSHRSSKVKIVSSIYFYSGEYEEKDAPAKQKENEEVAEEKELEPARVESPQAKELINKIMQLEELKKSGKLSDVQYTKLRQKAIRRYKD